MFPIVLPAEGKVLNFATMERLRFITTPQFVDGLAAKQTLFQDRKANMPEGSSTTRLFKEGYPRIVAKGLEELGETIQAFLEQDANQVNLEASQMIYYLMVGIVHSGKGSIEQVVTHLENKVAGRAILPETPGLGFRQLTESVGKAYQALMVDASTDEDVNAKVADVFLAVDSLIEKTGKGSWEGILAKL